MTKEEEIDRWRDWRDAQRRKRRHMTYGEYLNWCRGGDGISSPCEADPFPGGLTIDLNTPPIIGRTSND